MLLAEIKVEADNLEKMILEIEEYLLKLASTDLEKADIATKKLLNLIDKHRSHLIMINKADNIIEIQIGDSKASLANVRIICDALKRKINFLDRLIRLERSALDIFSLIEQRDKFLSEFTLISNSIKKAEWSTKID
jgi:hypothetical protein